MAVKINAGDDVRRGDVFFVDPYKIIIKEELRGRRKAPNQQEIIDLAESMFTNGQRQPCEVRKVQDNQIQLNLGFTRGAAARLIREGFDFKNPANGEVIRIHNPEFKLKVMISDANDDTALLNNIIENAHRNNTTPIDDAFNHQRLRDQLGYTDAEITRLYRYKDAGKVGKFRKLLGLPTKVQDMIDSEMLSVGGALALVELPPEEVETAIKAASLESGKVSGAVINDIVRDHHLRDAETRPIVEVPVEVPTPVEAPALPTGAGSVVAPVPVPVTPAPKKRGPRTEGPRTPARGARHLKEFFGQEFENEKHTELAKVFLMWLKGSRSDKTLLAALDAHAGKR